MEGALVSHAAQTNDRELNALLAEYRPWHTLPGAFYTEPFVYGRDIELIWRRGWLFAAHSCQLREPGDYVTLEVGNDSLLVLRDDNGEVAPCITSVGIAARSCATSRRADWDESFVLTISGRTLGTALC